MGHPLDIELLDVLEGQCDPEAAVSIKAHLFECQWCRTKMAAMVRHYMDVELTDQED